MPGLLVSHRGTIAEQGSGAVPPPSLIGKWDASTLGLTNGSSVSSWTDSSSGGANPLVQATGGNQPRFDTAVQNGLAGVFFNGTSTRMDATGFTVNQPDTMFIVAKSNASFNQFATDGNTSSQQFHTASAKWCLFAGSDLAGSAIDTTAHTFSGIFNGSSSELYKDGTLDLSGNPGTAALTSLRVGCTASNVAFWSGYIFEVRIYNGVFTTAGRQTIESALKTKWGTP